LGCDVTDFNRFAAPDLMAFAFQDKGEAAITAMFALMARSTVRDERFGFDSASDSICYEVSLKYGRADIVVYHLDGSATVIEVKDGGKGVMWVMAGLGQVSMYAMQLALMNKGAVTRVRKALLWTSSGDLMGDALIEEACEQAGTIALPWGRLGAHLEALGRVESAQGVH